MQPTLPYTPSELILRNDPIVAHHQEEGRRAFATLMDSVGTGSFSGQTIDYLRTYLKIDKSIIAIFSRTTGTMPEILFNNIFDARSCDLYLSYLQHHGQAEIFAAELGAEPCAAIMPEARNADTLAFTRIFHAYLGMQAELRVAAPIDEDRVAVLLLSKEDWSDVERAFVLRCAEILRPVILLHTRSRVATEPRGADWRLDHLRNSIGDDKLTSREFDIAMLILAGESTFAIADKLEISVATVKVHRRHIYAKLNISCQAELFALAFRGVSL
ncbi:MAG: helix-turn-helix transcriptional regulator [Sphingobium sp.]